MQEEVLTRSEPGADRTASSPAPPETIDWTKKVLSEMRKPDATVSKVARLLQFTPAKVREHLNEAKAKLVPKGRARFVVSSKHMFEPWPPEDFAKIEKARRDYDLGLVEVVTANVQDFRYLMAIPRKRRAEPRDWFGGVL